MPGPNLTGTPNTDDLWIGRGEVLISILDANNLPTKWRHLGNAPQFTISSALETKEHFSSMEGLKSQDKSVVLSDARTIKIVFEEMSDDNQALFFSGVKEALSGTDNAAVAGFSEFLMVADGDLEPGTSYFLVNSSGVRAMGVTSANLTVKTNEGPPATLIEGVDYDLDEEFGRIFMRADSTDVTDAATAGVGLLVTLAADSGAHVVNEVRGTTLAPVVVAVKFLGENAANGDKTEFSFRKVRLKASGDMPLIGDDWRNATLEGSLESNVANYPESPLLTMRSLGSALPQIVSAVFEYGEGDNTDGTLNIFFDKPVNINQAFVAALGDIKFRTAATLTGDWIGQEGEYWLNAGNFSDGMGVITTLPFVPGSGYYLSIPFSEFSTHATTLAAASTGTFNTPGLGLSSPNGLTMPVFSNIPVTSVPV